MINNILHIEDNYADLVMMEEILEDSDQNFDYFTAYNGREALELLELNKYNFKLILLDLNMPVSNGWDFLKKRLQIKNLMNIPVVILSTSNNIIEINDCYRLQANAYVVKARDFDQLKESIQAIFKFWLEFNHTPQTQYS